MKVLAGNFSGGPLIREVELARRGVEFRKHLQFGFRNSELRNATIQTNHKLGAHPDDGLINVFQSGEVDGNLSLELDRVF